MAQITGKATLLFDRPPRIIGAASIVGSKESDGPLGHLFDCIEEDPKFGKNTWEEAESELQLRTARKVLEKTGLTEEEVRYLFAGDLLAQGIATSYGIMELQIPLFGLYGACSTCGESLSLAAMCISAGYAGCVMALTSSHFASAEKEFRFPWNMPDSVPCQLPGRLPAREPFSLPPKTSCPLPLHLSASQESPPEKSWIMG